MRMLMMMIPTAIFIGQTSATMVAFVGVRESSRDYIEYDS